MRRDFFTDVRPCKDCPATVYSENLIERTREFGYRLQHGDNPEHTRVFADHGTTLKQWLARQNAVADWMKEIHGR